MHGRKHERVDPYMINFVSLFLSLSLSLSLSLVSPPLLPLIKRVSSSTHTHTFVLCLPFREEREGEREKRAHLYHPRVVVPF